MVITFDRDDIGFLINALRCARGDIIGRTNLTQEEKLRAEKYKYLYEKIIERDRQEIYIRRASHYLEKDDLDQNTFDVIYKEVVEHVPQTDPFWDRFRILAMKKGFFKEGWKEVKRDE